MHLWRWDKIAHLQRGQVHPDAAAGLDQRQTSMGSNALTAVDLD